MKCVKMYLELRRALGGRSKCTTMTINFGGIFMARAKTEKKHISFLKAALINNLVKDRAIIENRSESAIIEQVILDSFLPANKTARFIVSTYLYDDDDNPIGNTLSAIFSYNAAGVDWKSVNDNLLPLVQFAKNQLIYSSKPLSGDEPELHHCISQVETVIDMLKNLAEEKPELKNAVQYEVDYTSSLLKILRDDPRHIKLFNFYRVLLNNWDYFKSSTITYRLLMDLAILEKGWRDEAEVRVELLQIIKCISNEWEQE